MQCATVSIVCSQSETLPYYTGFDTPTEIAGWQQFRTGFLSSYDWGIGTSLYHDYNVGGNATDTVVDWFVSPPINFNTPSLLTLKVITSGFSTPIPDNCEIWFGTDNPDPSIGNFTLIANLSYMQPQNQWLDTAVNIPFVSDSGYIAFKYKTIGAAWMTYGIDSITVSSTVGIFNQDNSSNAAVNIYPNPNSGQFTLEIDLQEETELSIKLYHFTGQLIHSEVIGNVTGNYAQQMDLSRYAKGIYYVQTVSDRRIITRKIIYQ